jgi:hypothetical protein
MRVVELPNARLKNELDALRRLAPGRRLTSKAASTAAAATSQHKSSGGSPAVSPCGCPPVSSRKAAP